MDDNYIKFRDILTGSKEFSFNDTVLILKDYYTGETVKLDLKYINEDIFNKLDVNRIENLARQIDALYYEYDQYGYDDEIEDREENINNIIDDIQDDLTSEYISFCNDVIELGLDTNMVNAAKHILEELKRLDSLSTL